MKFYYLLIFTLTVNIATAQNQEIKNIDGSHIFDLFDQKINRTSDDIISIDHAAHQHLFTLSPHKVTLPFDLNGKTLLLELNKYELFSQNFTIQVSSGEIIKPLKINCYRGKIKAMDHSVVTMTVSEKEVALIIGTDNESYEINKSTSDNQYHLIKVEKIAAAPCHTQDEPSLIDEHPSNNTIRNSYADCLEMYVECDNAAYVSNGSSVPNTQTWVTNIFNNVSTLYNNYNVPIVISTVFVWNTADVYGTSITISQMRNAFVNRLISTGLSGKIGYLLSTKNITGGISYGIGGFCNPISNSVYPGPCALSCKLTTSVTPYPTFSYNIQNVAHELGHVMGLRHTHACVWNNNNTQIDDCGNVLAQNNNNTPEGNNCFDNASPILPGSNGTIMSSCDQLLGQAINFSTGFGPIAGDRLFLNFVNASCFTGVNCGSTPPNNDDCLDAIPLTLTQTCSSRTFDNDFGTQSASTPLFSCITQTFYTDVWFSAIIPSSGNLSIETKQIAGGLSDMRMQAYSGTCTTLTQIGCDDNNGDGNHALINLTGRTPGEKIWLRVTPIDGPGNDYGEFGMCAYDASVPCHPDHAALVSFYNSTNGASWTNKTGWVNNATNCNVCTWYGVLCDGQGRVKELNLGLNNLSGTIPSTITQLTKLTKLNLYSNFFTAGPIPTDIYNMPLLDYLDLGDNAFNGTLSTSLGNMVNIRSLYLDNNDFTGTLPTNLVNAPITILWLNNNNLSGCVPKSYEEFCQRGASVRLDNNPLLPGGGNYNNFCATSYGTDADFDTYCAGSQDCLDNDPLSYPGAPEICDGKDNDCDNSVDEGIADVTNNWIGTNGNWHTASNWSTGIVPEKCHIVVINPASAYAITISNGSTAKGSSITIGANATILIQNNATMLLEDKGELINNGTINSYGTLNISNPLNTSGTAFTNNKIITNNSSATINITNCGSVAILNNTPNGMFTNDGVINILNNHASNGTFGIDNRKNFINAGQITVENITGKEIKVATGALLQNAAGSSIIVK